jgi:hypothetical protein
MVQAEKPLPTQSSDKRDWWNDPLGVFKPDARPTALKVHGFIIGTFLGPLGVVAVAVFSSAEKRRHRLIGAVPGLALWLPLWIVVSGS